MSKVTIYTTPQSHYSDLAKEYFIERSVKFTEVDISKNQKKAEEMAKISGQYSVPVIKIGDEVIIGFDDIKLRTALKKLKT